MISSDLASKDPVKLFDEWLERRKAESSKERDDVIDKRCEREREDALRISSVISPMVDEFWTNGYVFTFDVIGKKHRYTVNICNQKDRIVGEYWKKVPRAEEIENCRIILPPDIKHCLLDYIGYREICMSGVPLSCILAVLEEVKTLAG